jgi:hypothetical protein
LTIIGNLLLNFRCLAIEEFFGPVPSEINNGFDKGIFSLTSADMSLGPCAPGRELAEYCDPRPEKYGQIPQSGSSTTKPHHARFAHACRL